MTAVAPSTGMTHARACARAWLVCALLAFAIVAAPSAAVAQTDDPVKGGVRITTDAGYGRMVFRLDEPVDAKVRVSGAILVIEFKKPVSVAVDRINASAPNYVSAARSDPDGMAIRIALAGRFRVNAIPAAERLFIDLLPEPWTGMMPGLPQDIVDELALRARQAEIELRKQRAVTKAETLPPVRVKVAKLPTAMRYVFDLPPGTNVIPEAAEGKLKLHFDQAIKWDLADAKATLPSTLESIKAEAEFETIAIVFQLNGMPETSTFREDKSFVVDVARESEQAKPQGDGAAAPVAAAAAEPTIATPETVPVSDMPALKDAPVLKDAPPLGDALPLKNVPAQAAAKEPAQQVAPLPKPPQTSLGQQAPPAPQALPKGKQSAVGRPQLADAAANAVKPAAASSQAVPTQVAAAPAPAQAQVQEVPAKAAPAAAPPPPDRAPEPAPTEPLVQARPAPEPPVIQMPEIVPPPALADNAIAALLFQNGDHIRVSLPFAASTPAAVFRRAETLWMVFDSALAIDVSALTRGSDSVIRKAEFERGQGGAAIVRIRLARPQLASLEADGSGWIVRIGDRVAAPSQPLAIARSIKGNSRGIVIPLEHAGTLHHLIDPDLGTRLMAITALGPARGILKPQDFVELRALQSIHGVVLQPLADDVTASIAANEVTISRPGGLSLSAASLEQQQQTAPSFRTVSFDPEIWNQDRQQPFVARQAELIAVAAAASEGKRRLARFDLARFYLAREMAAEAKAVLDVALAEHKTGGEVTGSLLKAVAKIMLNRPDEALKDLSDPQVGNQQDATVWRAMARSRLGNWPEAHAHFKTIDDTLRALPIELQRMVMMENMRTDLEVRDFAGATRIANEFETITVPAELEPSLAVLSGRLAESLGRKEDALTQYRIAAASSDRRAAAQGRLREIELLSRSGAMPRNETINELETLTTVWRGDETETQGLHLLARLYTEDSRYRDAFHVMRTALLAHPNSDMTRKIQDEAALTFDSIFIGDKGDGLPPIEALGLFYDFRELTPIGRRGDEMIRRLADRLVNVDLLDQAAELLQHQVDHRLQGAARAAVATRLAVVYLMNRKPDFALSALQKTRMSELSNELRDQRLLLEARALSDIGRHELALEVISYIKGREAIRLRADIEWAAQHWRAAAEQIELMLGDRWRNFTPLSDAERADVMRAAIGYALADEQIGLIRLREKYAAKMADGPDARAFAVVSAPIGAVGPEFQSVARRVAATDTLEGFLRDLNKRYPDTASKIPDTTPGAQPGQDAEKGASEVAPGPVSKAEPEKTPVAAPQNLPKGEPLLPDKATTGSIKPRAARFKQQPER